MCSELSQLSLLVLAIIQNMLALHKKFSPTKKLRFVPFLNMYSILDFFNGISLQMHVVQTAVMLNCVRACS